MRKCVPYKKTKNWVCAGGNLTFAVKNGVKCTYFVPKIHHFLTKVNDFLSFFYFLKKNGQQILRSFFIGVPKYAIVFLAESHKLVQKQQFQNPYRLGTVLININIKIIIIITGSIPFSGGVK